ncbi:MAG TPA: hypothetical protein VHD56_18645 [Tepidisphaeraceae bacterium]|nr:hypothetical protein [Tepidisphaeraceae bacterium]
MRQNSDQLQLQRLHEAKQPNHHQADPLGPQMLDFFKKSVSKRQTRLTTIAECFEQLVPQMLLEHCALESFSAGTLKVIVDSSSHLYELKQLLLSGLQQQLLIACKSTGLRKITLKFGKWYEGDGRDRRINFQ